MIKIEANCYCKNFSTSNEVAVIIIDKYGILYKLDIIFTKRVNWINKRLIKQMSHNHTAYIPLHYMFLFPHDDKKGH